MANERTFLAWLQTAIDIIGLGFVVVSFSLFLCEFGLIMTKESGQIQQEASIHSLSSMLGLSMVGLESTVYVLYNYRKAHSIIESGETYVSKHSIMYVASGA